MVPNALTNYLNAVIGAAIVHHDQLNVRIGLLPDRCNGFSNKTPVIITKTYNTYQREFHHKSSFSNVNLVDGLPLSRSLKSSKLKLGWPSREEVPKSINSMWCFWLHPYIPCISITTGLRKSNFRG